MTKPKCPNCETDDYMVLSRSYDAALDKKVAKVGHIVGAVLGGGTVFLLLAFMLSELGKQEDVSSSILDLVFNVMIVVTGVIGGRAVGKQALSVTGKVAGRGVDLVRSEYKCNKCGREIHG